MEAIRETAVLVVGGSLVGLSAAMFLAAQGVPTILVERHAGSSPHPRAIGYTPRTLELYRSVGLTLPEVPRGFRLRRARVESLAGRWLEETAWNPSPEPESKLVYSPHTGAAIAQDALEPRLRERALELGAELRSETELVSFEQDAHGVTASLRARGGAEQRVRASYLLAADGHRSGVRAALDIGRHGNGALRTLRSVLFRAPLDEYLGAGVSQFSVVQPDFEGFLTTYGDGRWVLMCCDDDSRDPRVLIEKAVGRADLPVEILAHGRWELAAFVADTFSAGRVFLAGDAAHCLPPTRGGYGANTGIDDAHNLAWKLAAVTTGAAGTGLLDSYDAERRPVAWLRHDQTFARPDYRAHAASASPAAVIDDDAMEFGQLYRSSAVIGATPALPAALRPEQWAGQPGTRLPFVTLADGRTTLDAFGRGWLLIGNEEAWHVAGAESADRLGVGLEVARTDELERFGVGRSGASLIRPDGYVACRFADLAAEPVELLTGALSRLSSRVRHAAAT